MTGREVSRNGRRQWVVLMLAGLMAACELTEVAIPASDPIVIVQAILRPDLNRQWVIVERSLTGAEERQSTPGDIPFDRPQLPITDASVTVENLSQFFRQIFAGPPSSGGAAARGELWAVGMGCTGDRSDVRRCRPATGSCSPSSLPTAWS